MAKYTLRVVVGAGFALLAIALAGCGGTSPAAPQPTATQPPITFATTQPTPTSTVPEPARSATLGPQGVPLQTGPFLASASTTRLATPVHGILCQELPQLAYRAYLHLAVYSDGRLRAIPGGIGMVGTSASAGPGGLTYTASTCEYWLHTRADDGVILMLSPRRRHFTLGDFFAIWHQPLWRHRVATLRGPVTALVNGKRWQRRPAAIPLRQHEDIELAVRQPVPAPQKTDWLGAGL